MAAFESRLGSAEVTTADITDLKYENDSLQSKFASHTQKLSACEIRLKSIENASANADSSKLKKDFDLLQEQMNYQAQARLRNDIEISGITEMPAENLMHLFLLLAVTAGMKLSVTDIDFVTRAGPPRNGSNDLPRPLVVRFCRRSTRDQFYTTARPRRLTTADLEMEGPARKIYFGDRLTRGNRHLFRECRTKFKEAGFKFCWTKWGQIYVKKHEGRGEGGKAIIVKSLNDIENIIQNSSATSPDNSISSNNPASPAEFVEN